MTPTPRLWPALALIAFSTGSAGTHAQGPSASDVLEAAAGYVVRYAQQVAIVVGEEQYTQYDVSSGQTRGSRRLKSDFAVVGLADGALATFRDAYQIDGTNMGDREERLATLFRSPATESSLAQARDLSDQSVRHYISPNLRVLDQPLLPLEFLRKQNQARFAFKMDSTRKMDGKEVAILRFTEQGPDRFIKSAENAPLGGRVWIELGSGAVRQTEISFSGKEFNVRSSVKYKADPALGLWLPSEMVLQSDIRGAGAHGISNMGAGGGLGVRETMEGRANYAKFRRVTDGSHQ
jgi:hypothetical protein